jgi:mono/diheme cytochrome c family protein
MARWTWVLVVVLAAACGRGPVTPLEEVLDLQSGRDFYERACASCHGMTGRGDGPEGAALDPRPADLTRLAQRHGGTFPREAVIATVTGEREIGAHGTRDMPVWRDRFGPADSPGAVATVYQRRRLELMADYLEGLQVRP